MLLESSSAFECGRQDGEDNGEVGRGRGRMHRRANDEDDDDGVRE